MTQQVLSCA